MNQKLFLTAVMVFVLGMFIVAVPVANRRTSHLPAYRGGK